MGRDPAAPLGPIDAASRLDEVGAIPPAPARGAWTPDFSAEGQERLRDLSPGAPAWRATAPLWDEAGVRVLAVANAGEPRAAAMAAQEVVLALAEAGRDVLLIDLDLDHPTFAKPFQYQPDEGIVDMALFGTSAGAALRKTPHERVRVVTVGSPPVDSGEVLASKELEEILASFRAEWDAVVVTLPLAGADGGVCPALTAADAVLIVAGAAVAVGAEVAQGIAALGAPPRVTGVLRVGAARADAATAAAPPPVAETAPAPSAPGAGAAAPAEPAAAPAEPREAVAPRVPGQLAPRAPRPGAHAARPTAGAAASSRPRRGAGAIVPLVLGGAALALVFGFGVARLWRSAVEPPELAQTSPDASGDAASGVSPRVAATPVGEPVASVSEPASSTPEPGAPDAGAVVVARDTAAAATLSSAGPSAAGSSSAPQSEPQPPAPVGPAPSTPPAAIPAGDAWGVQVASHPSHAEAAADSATRARGGDAVTIVAKEIPEKGGTWYRVIVGRFSDREEARAFAEEYRAKAGLTYSPVVKLPAR
jgi:Mrp family chromosome partitioning ATPase